MWEDCPEGVGRLSSECGEAVWMVSGGYLEGLGRLSGWCEKSVWRVWEG